MAMDLTILYWLLIVVMVIGVLGTILPGIPGASLILVAILAWGLATQFVGMGWAIATISIILILSAGIELMGAYWGAKRFGASKWGQIGAIAGMVAGFLGLLPALPLGGPLIGILLGAAIGAFLGEFFYRHPLQIRDRAKQAIKASLGIVIGSVIGNIVEFVLAIAAVAIFMATTWPMLYG
jgi:uncharacterized protein YqgC (DUF456 family)